VSKSLVIAISDAAPPTAIVAAGAFPVALPLMNHVREWCAAHGRFQGSHPRLVGTIEPGAVEIPEGLAERSCAFLSADQGAPAT
jgi:hypothetical protein